HRSGLIGPDERRFSSSRRSLKRVHETAMNRRVVLIEDNAAHAKLMERLLGRSAGFELERFDRLATGLPRLQAGGVDVVLLDLGLPDSDRHQTLGRVLAAAPDVPVVVLTTADDL